MDDFEKMIIDSMQGTNKTYIQLPEHNELLLYLHGLALHTERLGFMHYNAFLNEAIQLLVNSIFLYEDGLFDCAFYSIRQAGEVVDNMLYLSKNSHDEFRKWSEKKKFPQHRDIKDKLKEITSLIPEYFSHHDNLMERTNKIIHKQGFDTFYQVRNQLPDEYGFSQDEETGFFTESLKYTIGIILIMFIILEPISLALSDDEITLKLHFDPITEPIDVNYFSEYLKLDDIIDRIKSSEFYREFISNFIGKEPMLPAVYSVVRDKAWNVDALDEIEKQQDLLNAYECFMFNILKLGIRVSNFYFDEGFSWYSTSIRSNLHRHKFGRKEFEKYLRPDNRFNQPCESISISVIVMYDDPLYLEHNIPLTNDEILALKKIEYQGIQEVTEVKRLIAEFQQKDNPSS